MKTAAASASRESHVLTISQNQEVPKTDFFSEEFAKHYGN
jgi:hypothetical protein